MNKSLYRLLAGFRRFREKNFQSELENSAYQRLVTSGQSPKTLLIGCSDSRVDPAILTGASPGELFVIRNVANLVPPCEPSAIGYHGTSSAIEFAVVNLKVENIIVLGHRRCGGIRALIQGATEEHDSFIGQWMSIADEARKRAFTLAPDSSEDTLCRLAEREALRISVRNLHSFPFVREAIRDRGLNVIGVYFDLEQGVLFELNGPKDDFRPLEI